MPETAGPRKAPKAPKQTRQGKSWEKKCKGCLNLKFIQDRHGETKTFSGPFGPTNRVLSLKDIVKSMSAGCQICFAILKAIDALIMPYINGPPESPAELFPSSPKAHKFHFLAYLPGKWPRLSYISLLERKGLPVQVHVNIGMLLFGIADDKFGIGKAICRDGFAAAAGATDLQFVFELFSDQLAPAPFHGIAPARRVPARLSSARRRRLVKEWIDGCVKNHPHCCEPLRGQEDDDKTQPWRPKRLLDLGDSPMTSIRLVDGAGTSGPYATVSHAFNPRGSSDLVLDVCNLLELLGERIRWRDLPPVFQDAVVIASEQNIRYLWIHALCVIQESPQDLNWHTEQAHRIYGHSYLNIALERSTHLHETCLGTRWLNRGKGAEVQDVEIPVFKDAKPYKFYARPAVHHRESHRIFHYEPSYFPYHRPRNQKDIPDCPLLDSTDFLQEQIIAPRTLHIDTTELAWECRVETGCECCPSTTDIDAESFLVIPSLKLALASKFSDPDYFTPSQLWDNIRNSYIQKTVQRTGRAEEDRLSPLVGLGSCVASRFNMRFAAGLLFNNSDDLASQLLWYLGAAITTGLDDNGHDDNGRGRKRVSCRKHVPSWSWASIATEHSYSVGSPETMFDGYARGCFARDSDFQPHSIDFQPHSIDNTKPPGIAPKQPGEPCLHAHSWQLPVSGRLITGKIATRRHSKLYPSTGIYQFIAANAESFPPPLPPPPSQEPPSGGRKAPTDLPPPSPPFTAGYVMLDCDDFDAERRASAAAGSAGFTWAYFLLLGRVARSVVDVGLALRRAGDGKTGEFERIGVFWLAAGPRGLFGEAQVQDVVLV
ncbi:hypothetical protein CONLIGDRAFT_277029 [Coniochaeta ligniaria NRRL 30616]|uniref:Heterokaryon incompatibility domain-containing protein n=1 Tax=Coniochaeta ligniaria NRRL 30616 TaxID=1408157 RepID=A0A1J7JH95_9PEZI|nr:hypothetical protein CONLIGDRAFT_277029 [Coniochaeta ligniaria NRRL 30616]